MFVAIMLVPPVGLAIPAGVIPLVGLFAPLPAIAAGMFVAGAAFPALPPATGVVAADIPVPSVLAGVSPPQPAPVSTAANATPLSIAVVNPAL
jgi:hypothetical protein